VKQRTSLKGLEVASTMEEFLKSTEVIDWTHPAVSSRATDLSRGTTDVQEIARRCFEWVRDNIQHSSDFKRNPVTCVASEVLAAGTGCVLRGKAVTSPKSSRSAVRNDPGHDSGMMPVTDSDFMPVTFCR
jgi:transglutaminase-like putative cysteine protease